MLRSSERSFAQEESQHVEVSEDCFEFDDTQWRETISPESGMEISSRTTTCLTCLITNSQEVSPRSNLRESTSENHDAV